MMIRGGVSWDGADFVRYDDVLCVTAFGSMISKMTTTTACFFGVCFWCWLEEVA